MPVPGNINPAPPPSSFDQEEDFYEESRWKKLQRKIFEEPLIPLGCALTCWALFEATKSMRTGNKHKTNRMFRRRIYAQGFTVLAMLAGSIYWETDRARRKQYDGLVKEKDNKEKLEAWLRELEARAEEEEELKKMRKKIGEAQAAERLKAMDGSKGGAEPVRPAKDDLGNVKCPLEESEGGLGPIAREVRRLWEGRR